MSRQPNLSEIVAQKRILVATADLHRADLLVLSRPVCRLVRAAEAGVFAVRIGKVIARLIKH